MPPRRLELGRRSRRTPVRQLTGLKDSYYSFELEVQLQRKEGYLTMTDNGRPIAERPLVIRGARLAMGPRVTSHASIEIADERISRIFNLPPSVSDTAYKPTDIDLNGFLLLPGLVNAHDHLQFALFPRLGKPPYGNYIDWGDDIHRSFPEIILKHHAIPKADRLWWGGIRNLLCGVTTVCHHDPLWPELQRGDFPVRVVREYGWAHSLALGGDLRHAHDGTPAGQPFVVHSCEGIDELARNELEGLDRRGLLDNRAVLVHGLAITREGAELIRDRGASLIICPSSNRFLYGKVPEMSILDRIEHLALGSDSPLSAEGDLLDEVRFAMSFLGISTSTAYHMVTTAAASILRLGDGQGSIKEFGLADLIAVRDTGHDPADKLATLSMNDMELVMLGGRVQLATKAILERLPFAARNGLEPLSIGGSIRWLRAPVRALLKQAEEVLGRGAVRLGCKELLIPAGVVSEHVK
jgi:cytosine/adenosine deaminase-related metal-dependent hydrolase